MNHCKTCKHWTRYTKAFDIKWRGSRAGTCDSEKFANQDGSATHDGLNYWGSYEESAGFETGEDFGCVHHEATNG
jgi:hypothetical protein